MLDSRRCFSKQQRRQILIAADYKCEHCYAVLYGVWHAHHRVQWSKGGVTEIHNGMALCESCHRRIHAMTFIPRKWQVECHERERQHRIAFGSRSKQAFMIEACPGAGKSSMAAMIAKEWLNKQLVNHVLIVAPWTPIVASICMKCDEFHLETKRDFFNGSRFHPQPHWDVTVLANKGAFKDSVLDAIRQWRNMSGGWKYGLIIDEIHHCSENRNWGQMLECLIEDCEHWVAMSGTPFRSDGHQIIGLRYNDDMVIPDYRLTYRDGVEAGYVRDVTVRWIDGDVTLYDNQDRVLASKPYCELTTTEINGAKSNLFDADEKLVEATILAIHKDLMELRASSKEYSNAAALFVCRPGTSNGEETKRLYQVANRIKKLTGIEPVTVSHADKDSDAKLEAFRRGEKPYLVAVNKVSEGCDIPRIISIGLLRFIESPLLIRQIVGRAIRRQGDWDNRAAMIYAPKLSTMKAELDKIYEEGSVGKSLRKKCDDCGQLPCVCIRACEYCGNDICDCERCTECGRRLPQCICNAERRYEYIDSDAVVKDGTFDTVDVEEAYIQIAQEIAFQHSQFRGVNTVSAGAFLKLAGMPISIASTKPSIEQERRSLIEKCERLCRRLAKLKYHGHEALCFSSDISPRFSIQSWSEAKRMLSFDQSKRLVEHLTLEIQKGLSRGS
jgi:superfamily II DNA or RNA helicase